MGLRQSAKETGAIAQCAGHNGAGRRHHLGQPFADAFSNARPCANAATKDDDAWIEQRDDGAEAMREIAKAGVDHLSRNGFACIGAFKDFAHA